MSEHYTFNFPTHIRFGIGVLEELPAFLQSNAIRHPLIVSDTALLQFDFFSHLLDKLIQNYIEPRVFSDIAKNPVKSNVLAGIQTYKEHQCDAVIGFGGGASIDVARAIALMINHDGDLFDYEDSLDGWKRVVNEIPFFITIPTTSGTGSEVGRSTVISDDETHKKNILFSPKLMARAVFADPMVTEHLPAYITAATGMDAFTHCIEAYLSKGFHPMCDGIALEGIRLIGESLGHAVLQPTMEHRANMMAAAMMGAVAFQKGLGVVHSTAHPLSTMFDLHHGLANAIMLPHGLQFNQDVCNEKYHIIAKVLELKDETGNGFLKYLRELRETIGIPLSLEELHVNQSHLEKLSELAFQDVCHQCNPKPVTKDDFYNIYVEAL